MRPSALLLRLIAVWAALALLPLIARIKFPESADEVTLLWSLIGAALAAIASIDLSRRRYLNDVVVQRHWPESFAVGVSTAVEMEISHRAHLDVSADGRATKRPVMHIAIREDNPTSANIIGLAEDISLRAGESARLRYRVLPQQRGDLTFGALWLRITSRWQLWEFCLRRGDSCSVKVYPNFTAISNFAALGIDAQIGAMGIHLQHRRGEGMDFRQLRYFREGDSLRQIDWKATARYQKPISREYQDERDQDVIFLLDCGRRMRTLDGELSHFDHALNAVLLTGYVALRQGDAVGLMAYAGSNRWLAPVKSQSSINRLINHVYDLHSSTDTSDFLQAAQQLLNRHRKRSLIILISDVRDEDAADLRAACQLLSSRHLVVVASLREAILDADLDERTAQPIHHFSDALRHSGTALYRTQRAECLQTLRRNGITVVDCLPQHLHVDLVTQYLAMKRSGVI